MCFRAYDYCNRNCINSSHLSWINKCKAWAMRRNANLANKIKWKTEGIVIIFYWLMFTWTHQSRSHYNQINSIDLFGFPVFSKLQRMCIDMLCLRTNASFPLNTFRRSERNKRTRKKSNAYRTTPLIIYAAPFSSSEAKVSCEMRVNDSFICM